MPDLSTADRDWIGWRGLLWILGFAIPMLIK
jgi:hypothetical protein